MGQVLGGTPWRMEVGEILAVVPAALVLPFVLVALDTAYEIGSPDLPAPQAGLMALMSQGIVQGQMAWPLVIAGMFLAVTLILINAPSPMLIAVGMYLPFHSTAGIFVGGVIKWVLERSLAKRDADDAQKTRAQNTGVLLSSGFIAGGALMAVVLAFVVLAYDLQGIPTTFLDNWRAAAGLLPNGWFGLIAFAGMIYALVNIPLKAALKKN